MNHSLFKGLSKEVNGHPKKYFTLLPVEVKGEGVKRIEVNGHPKKYFTLLPYCIIFLKTL
jgi:hypothetical protein